jgi:broad specificity phosphatase PhoE
MARQTAKYEAALEVARREFDPRLVQHMTQPELYVAIEARGYRWNTAEWEPTAALESGTDTLIRVMGDMAAVEQTTMEICAALVARGYRIVKLTDPRDNYDGDGVRQYVTVNKGR